MKTTCKAMTKFGILGALAAMPLYAQIPNGLTFTTSFPFLSSIVGASAIPILTGGIIACQAIKLT